MNKITATIITHNEQDNLERCLNALKGIADEIVVVDSGSDDQTVAIAQRYGARVSERQFTGYGSQRQYAASLATHRYVLAIDADEVLSEPLRQSILAVKNNGIDMHRVYSFRVVEFYFGHVARFSAIDCRPKIRLFDGRYAQWNLSDLGEKVTFSEALRPVILEGPLLHYRANSLAEFRRKEAMRARLSAQALVAKGAKIGALTPKMKAAQTYMHMLVRRRAIIDGRIGRIIAKEVARGVHDAYVYARRQLAEQ